MSVLDDVEALADKSQAPALKAAGWRDAILAAGALPQSWSFSRNGHAFILTVTAVSATRGLFRMDGAVTRDGVPVRNGSSGTALFPVLLVNPPLLYSDPTGDVVRNGRTYRHNLIILAKQILADVLSNA